jgi:hypothetical protein
VTTLATFEIAEIYRKLGQDIMKSERPKKLPTEQLEEYNSLLEEQAFPFEEQAISTHEINTARTRDGVYDEGVKKSFAALAELKPGRYGKSEILAASFDSLVPPVPPVQAPPPPIAAPADPTAAPVAAGATATPPAPSYNIPKPPARANGEFTRALGLMRSDPTQASLEFQLMSQSYPDLPGPYANLGLLYRNANQLADAETSFQKATEHAPWGCGDVDRIRRDAAPGRQVRRGAHRLREGDLREPDLRAGASQPRRAARPVPRGFGRRAVQSSRPTRR